MKYLFELSKEQNTIPISEIISCLNAENINFRIIKKKEDVFIIDSISNTNKIKKISDRLSFSYYIDNFLFSCKPDKSSIDAETLNNKIQKEGSIAVRCKNRSTKINSKSILEILADVYTNKRIVDLKNPDIELRGLITDEKLYVGIKIAEINRSQYEKRKVQFRPYFSPISLHPKIARVMVNLSSIRNNEVLLDPFCGTGGILIEAGLIGAKIIGSDIENKMIEGCKKNLDFYKIKNYKLYCKDIGEIRNNVDKVDAVVTDLPYGKSTTTKGEEMKNLYKRAFENIADLLKLNGKAVIGLSNNDFVNLGEKYLTHVETHKFKAHRSLNRYFVVYKN